MRWTAATSRGPATEVDGFRGRVVAAFPRSIYVAPASGHLLLLHDVTHGCTPTSIRLDPTELAGLPVGTLASGRAGHLRVGDLVVDVRQATRWCPRAPLRRLAVGRGWASDLPRPDTTLRTDVTRILLAARDEVGSLHAALLRLVGSGPGLTPAGDDALVGMLAVLHRAVARDAAAIPLARLLEALPTTLHRTTEISAHYLRLALAGEFSEPLLDVVDDVAGSGAVDPGHLDALLRTGATSGTDALSGVVTAISLVVTPCSSLEEAA